MVTLSKVHVGDNPSAAMGPAAADEGDREHGLHDPPDGQMSLSLLHVPSTVAQFLLEEC